MYVHYGTKCPTSKLLVVGIPCRFGAVATCIYLCTYASLNVNTGVHAQCEFSHCSMFLYIKLCNNFYIDKLLLPRIIPVHTIHVILRARPLACEINIHGQFFL